MDTGRRILEKLGIQTSSSFVENSIGFNPDFIANFFFFFVVYMAWFFFYLETMNLWIAFEERPFKFWREIWIQVVVNLLQL